MIETIALFDIKVLKILKYNCCKKKFVTVKIKIDRVYIVTMTLENSFDKILNIL